MERRRLVADRFRRIWAIVEYIAGHPGCSRRDLAEQFSLSERQLQADLNVIRLQMGLPLVRRQGYRFVAAPTSGTPSFGLADAHLLGVALDRAVSAGEVPADRVRALAAKLPQMFPVHLQPLLRRALAPAAAHPPGEQQAVFEVLAEAMDRGAAVRLRYAAGRSTSFPMDPVIEPELVLPYSGGWYVIGQCPQKRRVMMLCLDSVAEATLAGSPSVT